MTTRRNKKYLKIPDFLIIGAGKSGTTSVNNYLKQHPQIFIPARKEPNFYGYELKTTDDFEGSAEKGYFTRSVTRLQDYLQMFEDAREDQVLGETSNTYLYHEDAPGRIRFYNPEMKLIAILRQPADRLWSRYMHLGRENKLPTKNFADCLDPDTIWWKRNDLIREGLYYKNLSRYFDFFPESQIKVILYDDLNASNDVVLKEICEFIGVDTSITLKADTRYNPSGLIKNPTLDALFGPKGFIQNTVKTLLPEERYQRLKQNEGLQRVINTVRKKNLEKPEMDPEIRKILTREVYGDDLNKLQRLIDKDISHWML